MTDRPPYAVILKDGLPDLEREFLRRYCHELHGNDGRTVLQFLCTRIDTGDPRYLWMEAELPRRQGRRRLRLPHEYVFLIDEDSQSADRPALADGGPRPDHPPAPGDHP